MQRPCTYLLFAVEKDNADKAVGGNQKGIFQMDKNKRKTV
jgi:hypothetical protein